jgi:UDP-N-acetylmuramoyl-tripeptide--D-alanyl-D-alanine ligase
MRAVTSADALLFDKEIQGFAIDSRTVKAGEIFFALSGPDYVRHSFTGTTFTDAHEFIPQAFAQGALAAVALASRVAELGETLNSFRDRLLLVDDVIEAMQRLARHTIENWGGRVVGITGSAGKTTTKNLTAHILSESGRRVMQGKKNFNNELGLPLAILQMETAPNRPSDFDTAVLEMGMSMPGELRRVVSLAPPDIAVELCVMPVHLEFFGTVDFIAENKRAVVEGMKPDGTAILNADDPRVAAMREHVRGNRVLTFGIEKEADVTATEIEVMELGRTQFELKTPGGTARAELGVPGRHNLMNALAAASVATCFEIEAEQIARLLSTAEASEMRGVVLRFRENFTVIDDSYNSNPRSLLFMVRTLVEGGQTAKRRIVVAGEMLELGADAPEMHRASGNDIARAGVDLLWGVRGRASEIVEGAREAGMTGDATRFFESSDEAAEAIVSEIRAGDMILIKGSRGVRTDKIVSRVREKFSLDEDG